MLEEIANVGAIPTSEVAARLGVGVSTVHDMVRRGELTPAMKLPGLRGPYLFEAATVDALVDKREEDRA